MLKVVGWVCCLLLRLLMWIENAVVVGWEKRSRQRRFIYPSSPNTDASSGGANMCK